MNQTTKALLALLLTENFDELVAMFRAADGIEEFAERIRYYTESVLLEEADWDAIARHFAELPFDT